MHRLLSLLVSSRNRIKQQSGYEPEPRKELVQAGNRLWLKDTVLGNAVVDVADSE